MPKPAKISTIGARHRSAPYSVLTNPVSPTAIASSHGTSPQASSRDRRSSHSWSAENDELLMRARQQSLNWAPIASQYFPGKTGNACRKRHERLMLQRKNTDNWDVDKMENLAKVYLDVREQMWKILADIMGEKWQNVESKCFEKGLRTLQSAGRTASRRKPRNQAGSEFGDKIADSRFQPSTHHDEDDRFNDSAIGPDDHHSFAHGRDDHQKAPYSAGGLSSSTPSYSSVRSFSNAPSSLAAFTPTKTSAPLFSPLQQPQQQTLPSFSTAFGTSPGISAVMNHPIHSTPDTTQ